MTTDRAAPDTPGDAGDTALADLRDQINEWTARGATLLRSVAKRRSLLQRQAAELQALEACLLPACGCSAATARPAAGQEPQ